MISFFQAIPDNPLLQNGLLAGAAAAVACGVVGPYVIAHRIMFLCGAIAHAAVGGLGLVVLLATTWPTYFGQLSPIYGAMAAALVAAVIMACVQHMAQERLDTLIGAMWAVGMATGLMLIKMAPGYQIDLMSYLFGNITTVLPGNVYLMIILDACILVIAGFWHKQFCALAMDEQFAQAQGVSPLLVRIVLLSLVSLTVICLVQIVGLILVLALLSLPAATVGQWTRRMPAVMTLACLLAGALTILPRAAVYQTRISPECAIVLTAAGLYLASVAAKALLRYHRPASHGKASTPAPTLRD